VHVPVARALGTVLSIAALSLLALATDVVAQDVGAAVPPKRDTVRAPLFTVRDAAIGAAFVVTTIAMAPLDRRIAGRLQDSSTQAIRFAHHVATATEKISTPGAYVIGGSLYVVGRVAHIPRAADLGLHGTEAVIVGDIVTGLLKGTLGRARPFVSTDTNPRDFKFGRGFGGKDQYTSFPSGHTTTAFAAAAAVTSETYEWWPKSVWVIAPLMYGGATTVGLSRMYHNKHWASDVALGAGIGTFSGLKVVRFNHTHKGDRIDRWLLGATLQPDGSGGAALAWNVPFR
jgi:membrane-associated phospholipid phosphatase